MEGMRVDEGKKDFKKRNGVKVVMKMKEQIKKKEKMIGIKRGD